MTIPRARIGTVLVVAFMLLLVACVVKRVAVADQLTHRKAVDRTLFVRYAQARSDGTGRSGRFGHPHVNLPPVAHPARDHIVCAAHHPNPRVSADYWLCLTVAWG